MRWVAVAFMSMCCLVFTTGCFSRNLGFQPATAPELTSQAASPLTGTKWLVNYHDQVESGFCADNKSKPTNGNCPDGTAYTAYLQGLRNSYLEAVRAKIDFNYRNFKTSLYSGNAVFGMMSDWAVIGLSGAGTVVGDAGLKSILAVASGGVTGATASYQKEVMNQQNTLAVAAAMDAGRAAQYVVITQGEALDVNKYPIENGVADLEKYYDSGTLIGGLLYIQGQMQSQSQASQGQSQGVKNSKPNLAISTTSLTPGKVGTAYQNTTLDASGGLTPYTWQVSAGSLPAGLALAGTTGKLLILALRALL